MSADLPPMTCSKCGRKSWGSSPGDICGIPQPSGGICDGLLEINTSYVATFMRAHGRAALVPAQPVAQYQVRHKRSDFWINCPNESQYNETIATGLYVGRKLYEHA